MTVEINIPDIGDSKVEVTEVLVKVGDKVTVEQPLITVEGDKASIEIPSPKNGIIKEIKVNVGDKVSSGSLIMIFETENTLSTSISMVEKEKITTLLTNNVDTQLSFDAPLKRLENKSEFLENNNACFHATPSTRRFAREFDVNLKKIKNATGRKGRILREDVLTYIKKAIKYYESIADNVTKNSSSTLPLNLLPWPKVDFCKFGKTEKIELSHIKRISGANLSRNWIMIPHVTLFDKADITDLESFRKQQNDEAKKCNSLVKITHIIFIIKAVSVALEKMPHFNSSLSEDGHYLILKKYINIGIAVDTQKGLVVPVLKNVNKKNITELTEELSIISEKARDGKLIPSEMQGGCFTISNIGRFGTNYFSPIINAPEVAILGVSKSFIESVWNGKEFSPRLMLPFSLSFDHRVIDGVDGARFMTIIIDIMNDIRRLII